tara:strand:+ start:502 stop:801 length:300 start_codon:yes stop_codon:yes gene_type:complete
MEQLFEALSLSFLRLSGCCLCVVSSTSGELEINLIGGDHFVVSFDQVDSLYVGSVSFISFDFILVFVGRTVIVESRLLNKNVTIISDLLNFSLSSHFFN